MSQRGEKIPTDMWVVVQFFLQLTVHLEVVKFRLWAHKCQTLHTPKIGPENKTQ